MVRKLNYSLSKLNYSICLGALTNNIIIKLDMRSTNCEA